MVLSRNMFVTCFLALVGFTLPCAAETVLLDFTLPGCGPCQEMQPVVNQLKVAGFQVQEIDGQSQPQIAARFKVTQFPTFIALVDGRETSRLVGLASYQQLQQMLSSQQAIPPMRRAMPLGQSPDNFSAPVAPGGQTTFATQPPTASIPTPQQAVDNPFGTPSGGQAVTGQTKLPAGSAVENKRLIEATVKIAVQDPEGMSAGTGTIVDARSGEALVLTCGHLFRESAGKGSITVTLFQAGPAGAEIRTTAPGRLIDYDLERDLALVSLRTDVPIQSAPIAAVGTALVPNAAVTTVGCNHGANPTAIASRISAIDRYQGHPNVEVVGAPVEGRSGGGLFNAAGQLIGVCFAADPESNEGLYASLPSIVAKLDSLGLSMVYQASVAGTQPSSVALQAPPVSDPSFAVRGQEPMSPSARVDTPPKIGFPPRIELPPIASPSSVAANPTTASMSPSEQATLEELQRRSENSEVICIVRPKNANGKSEVISLSNASPEFVRSLVDLATARDVARR